MKYIPLALFALSLLLYANTLGHGFVLDDEVVLRQNTYVQHGVSDIGKLLKEDSFAGYLKSKGVNGQIITGGRYRPLSLVLFAIGVQLFGNQTFVFHLLNMLLFACCTLFFYKAVRELSGKLTYSLSLSLGAALLFAVHPVHTEVVANIKSADELLSFLLGILAFRLGIAESFSWKKQVVAATLIFLSCLSKEIGAVWVALIPLARWLLYSEKQFIVLLKTGLPALGVIFYLVLRINATGLSPQGAMMHDPLNNPFVHPAEGQWIAPDQPASDTMPNLKRQWKGTNAVQATSSEKMTTVAYTMGRYLQLILMPIPLTHDYYPRHITIKNWADPMVWLSLIAVAGFVLDGVKRWRRRSLSGLGLIWYLMALLPVSNLFFPVGVFMAERFLLLPSAGFCIAVAALYSERFPVTPTWRQVVLTGILASLGFMTIVRNMVWKSNETLFRSDIAWSPESAKLEFNLANTLMIKALSVKDSVTRVQDIRETIPYFEKAAALHPFYFDAWQGVGASHFFTGNYEKATNAYAIAAAIKPNDPLTTQNLNAAVLMYKTEKDKSNSRPTVK
jgi:tetratricopeptide (TPR) repeat protein